MQNPSKRIPCCRYTAIAAALDAVAAGVSIGEFRFTMNGFSHSLVRPALVGLCVIFGFAQPVRAARASQIGTHPEVPPEGCERVVVALRAVAAAISSAALPGDFRAQRPRAPAERGTGPRLVAAIHAEGQITREHALVTGVKGARLGLDELRGLRDDGCAALSRVGLRARIENECRHQGGASNDTHGEWNQRARLFQKLMFAYCTREKFLHAFGVSLSY